MTVEQCEKVLRLMRKKVEPFGFLQDLEQPLRKFRVGIGELSLEQAKDASQEVGETATEAILQIKSLLVQRGLATWEEKE